MATWNDFVTAAKNRNLIRKSLDAAVLTADTTVTLPATIIDPTTKALVVPATFKPLGWHTDDGLAWSREVENSELTAHGSAEAVRTDARRVTNTLEVTAMETNIQTMGHSLGVKLDPTAGTAGEVTIVESSTPATRSFRCLALSVDNTDFGEIYFGKLYASAQVTATSPGAWVDGDSAQSHGLTITAYRDATAGFAVKHFIAGPGFAGLRVAMGWTAAS